MDPFDYYGIYIYIPYLCMHDWYIYLTNWDDPVCAEALRTFDTARKRFGSDDFRRRRW